MKFIHLSDLHFHCNENDNIKATTMLGYIKEQYPEHNLIITGDIVDDGHEEQYERVYEALEPFKKHIFLCPGNHDFGAAGNLYSWERAERFDKFLSLPLKQGGTFTGDSTPVVNVLKENNDCVMIIPGSSPGRKSGPRFYLRIHLDTPAHLVYNTYGAWREK